jgi:hypothetical protein
MSGWRLVALLATPPVMVMLFGVAAVCGAILYVTRES